MNRFERALLWSSAVLVGGSGVAYAVLKYLIRTDDTYAVVNHPLQPYALKVHIVSAPLLVFAVGVVFTRHIWEQWSSEPRRGRASGAGTLLTVLPMVFSGYLIQAVTHEGWLRSMVAVHLITGFAYLIGFVAHRVATGARARRDRRTSQRTLRVIAAGPGPVATGRPLPRRRPDQNTAGGGP